MTAFDCWMTTASLFWGMCIWTFLGGIVTTLLIHLNAASSEYTAKITALNQYMAHRRLPQVWRKCHVDPLYELCDQVRWIIRALARLREAKSIQSNLTFVCLLKIKFE